MLKLNELRIGNFISDTNASDSFFAKVKKLDYSRCYYGQFHSAYSDLKPIPITEEWLLKFGFKWKNNAMRLGDFCIRQQIDGWMLYISNESNNKVINLEFVHVLQNTYFYIELKELQCVDINHQST